MATLTNKNGKRIFAQVIRRMRDEGFSLMTIAGDFALSLKRRADAEARRG
jgi:hypothetical protein